MFVSRRRKMRPNLEELIQKIDSVSEEIEEIVFNEEQLPIEVVEFIEIK